MRIELLGQLVNHSDAVGRIVVLHDDYVEVEIPGERLTRLLLTRVAEERIVTPRASFTYRPGDREAHTSC